MELGKMRPFVGTKALLATPMSRAAYCDYRGWSLPENEDGDDEGMFVEYVDGGKANDDRHEGYISWSPLDVFERAYKPSGTIDFGAALAMLKQGHAVARSGWNGKGMFVYLVGPGRYPPSTPTGELIAKHQDDGLVPYLPYIAMKTVTGEVVPWLASQTDLIAEDWELALRWDEPAEPFDAGDEELEGN